MKGYVFVSNSTKPTPEEAESRKAKYPQNVSRPCLKAALLLGYEVFWGVNRNRPEEIACDLPVKMYDSHTYRSLFAISDNLTAIRNLDRVIREHKVDAIHCNTPVGGLIGRICGRKNHVRKVLYTAHGFHFYKGAPLMNRTLFKWAEMFLARWTDVLITMNQEDFEAAKKFRLRKGGRVYKVHGVGIDVVEYQNTVVDRSKKRAELGLQDTDLVCISAGDLIDRKNYLMAIRAIAKAKSRRIHYLICGEGPERETLSLEAKRLGVEDRIHFLGFRTDIKELYKIADLFLLTSLQEGLPRSMMEAMAAGLPVIASRIRGNVDLVRDGEGGFLFGTGDVAGYAKAIRRLGKDETLRASMGQKNLVNIRKYDSAVVEKEILHIYRETLGKA